MSQFSRLNQPEQLEPSELELEPEPELEEQMSGRVESYLYSTKLASANTIARRLDLIHC